MSTLWEVFNILRTSYGMEKVYGVCLTYISYNMKEVLSNGLKCRIRGCIRSVQYEQ